MGKCEIWIALRNAGHSPFAAAAILGNIQAESACRADNVEDRCPMSDADYTAAVDEGRISREQFCRDALGYGLCQWTYHTRKAALYELCREKGVSIGDERAQLQYLESELRQPEYASLRRCLETGESLGEMTRRFMVDFERPADRSRRAIDRRVALAEGFYGELSGRDKNGPTLPWAEGPCWPPRMLDEGMTGPDVLLYRAALQCRGYLEPEQARFDAALTEATRRFQLDRGLDTDGVIGPLTGRALLDWG